MNNNSFNNMFTCYEKGLNRLNDLLYQEVHKKIPCSVVGRRSKDVAFVKVKEHNMLAKEINKRGPNEEIEKIGDNLPVLVEDITAASIDETTQVEISSLKHKRHKKTNQELEILQEVFNHPTELPKDVTKELFENLYIINNSWSTTKVREYWYNNVKRKQK
jgi:hypothetical protein